MVKVWIARGILGFFGLLLVTAILAFIWENPDHWQILKTLGGIFFILGSFIWAICTIVDHHERVERKSYD